MGKAAQEGSIDEDDELLIKSVVAFNDLEVQKNFVPRMDIISINSKKSTEEIAELFESSGLSRLPYCQDNIDDEAGVVHQKDFYHPVLKREKTRIDYQTNQLYPEKYENFGTDEKISSRANPYSHHHR
ncbi:hypothetical protein [Enterococcus gilvus]|uniref:hypothetical protein n=1 Tax=Enterococcus gilvus TaxID=160453 RepID=UPI003EDAC67E